MHLLFCIYTFILGKAVWVSTGNEGVPLIPPIIGNAYPLIQMSKVI